MAAAEKFGAVTVPGGKDQAAKIRELTGGRGVDAMYRTGQIVPAVEKYSLDNALEAYETLRDGTLSARAVVAPHA